jgi:hypothetical protein
VKPAIFRRLAFSLLILSLCGSSLRAQEAGGNYNGLTVPVTGDARFAGLLDVDVLATGAYTGSFIYRGMRFSLAGTLDANHRFENKFALSRLQRGLIFLQLIVRGELDARRRVVTGVVEEKSLNSTVLIANFTLSGAAAEPALSAALSGGIQISFIEPPNTEIEGDGFTVMTFNTSTTRRTARFVGQLPDGEKFTGGADLHGTSIPVLSAVYRTVFKPPVGDSPLRPSPVPQPGGIAFGAATASLDAEGTPTIESPLRWYKGAGTDERYYRAGFEHALSIATRGYPRLRKRGRIPLGVLKKPGNATLTLKRGNLNENVQVLLNVAAGNPAVYRTVSPRDGSRRNPHKVRVKVNALMGTFTGSFIHPDSLQTTTFAGAFKPKSSVGPGEGRGSFRGSTVSGSLDAAEAGSVRITVNE